MVCRPGGLELCNVAYAIGNYRRDSCEFSPSSSPDVINVGAIQEAVDPYSPIRGRCNVANHQRFN